MELQFSKLLPEKSVRPGPNVNQDSAILHEFKQKDICIPLISTNSWFY